MVSHHYLFFFFFFFLLDNTYLKLKIIIFFNQKKKLKINFNHLFQVFSRGNISHKYVIKTHHGTKYTQLFDSNWGRFYLFFKCQDPLKKDFFFSFFLISCTRCILTCNLTLEHFGMACCLIPTMLKYIILRMTPASHHTVLFLEYDHPV